MSVMESRALKSLQALLPLGKTGQLADTISPQVRVSVVDLKSRRTGRDHRINTCDDDDDDDDDDDQVMLGPVQEERAVEQLDRSGAVVLAVYPCVAAAAAASGGASPQQISDVLGSTWRTAG